MATPPVFGLEEASRVLREVYGVEGELDELPSYADRNFRVRTSGSGYVLKIARPDEPDRELDFQDRAIEHLQEAGLPGPALVRNRAGGTLSHVQNAQGDPVRARLLSWVEGTPLAHLSPRPPLLLEDFGVLLARMDRALQGFSHPAAGRALPWDLRFALDAREHLELLGPEQSSLVAERLDAFERSLAPHFEHLPTQVIHNDPNDHNVLVQGERVVALIDFGDMVSTARACDPAIAIAYLMLEGPDPFAPARAFLEGYLAHLLLEPRELEALALLVPTRLAVSVLYSTRAKRERPGDPYLDVTEPHAWALLETLAGVSSDELLQRILPR